MAGDGEVEGDAVEVEALAAIDAALRARGRAAEAEILAERGMSRDAFRKAKAALTALVQAELAAGHGEVIVRYTAALRRARAGAGAPGPARRAESGDGHARAPAAPLPESRVETPTFLARERASDRLAAQVAPASERLDGTVELGDAVVPPAPLPFAKAASAVSSMLPPATPTPPAGPRLDTGTREVDLQELRASVLPFPHCADGPVPPASVARATPTPSLERYALLRATLRVRGEDDAGTWARFGLRSIEEKRALEAAFAERFRRDTGERERFLVLVRELLESFGRSGSGTTDTDDELAATVEAQRPGPSGDAPPGWER
jgi:hypothetical protein